MVLERHFLDDRALAHPGEAVVQRHPGARDGGRAGAAVRLQHVAIDCNLAFAEGRQVDDGAQAAADQALDFLRATGRLAGRRFAPRPGRGGPRQHGIFGRHPAAALAAQPRRRLVLERGGAEHVSVAELHQAGAFGIARDAALERDGAQRIGCTFRWSHRCPPAAALGLSAKHRNSIDPTMADVIRNLRRITQFKAMKDLELQPPSATSTGAFFVWNVEAGRAELLILGAHQCCRRCKRVRPQDVRANNRISRERTFFVQARPKTPLRISGLGGIKSRARRIGPCPFRCRAPPMPTCSVRPRATGCGWPTRTSSSRSRRISPSTARR